MVGDGQYIKIRTCIYVDPFCSRLITEATVRLGSCVISEQWLRACDCGLKLESRQFFSERFTWWFSCKDGIPPRHWTACQQISSERNKENCWSGSITVLACQQKWLKFSTMVSNLQKRDATNKEKQPGQEDRPRNYKPFSSWENWSWRHKYSPPEQHLHIIPHTDGNSKRVGGLENFH